MACRAFDACRARKQRRHDDGFIAQPSATMFVTQRIWRHHTCQVRSRLIGLETNHTTVSLAFPFRRKISAHEFERGGLLKPILNTIDGTPTFLSDSHCGSSQHSNGMSSSASRAQRLSRSELKHLEEREMIFELVREIEN